MVQNENNIETYIWGGSPILSDLKARGELEARVLLLVHAIRQERCSWHTVCKGGSRGKCKKLAMWAEQFKWALSHVLSVYLLRCIKYPRFTKNSSLYYKIFTSLSTAFIFKFISPYILICDCKICLRIKLVFMKRGISKHQVTVMQWCFNPRSSCLEFHSTSSSKLLK